MDIVVIVAGLLVLVVGGDALVRGSVTLAELLGLSPMVIGLTLVGFGTSTPELVTSLQAAFAGSPGIAVGNVVGSNIANVLLILGVSAVVAPIAVKARALRRDSVTLGLSAITCAGLVTWGVLGRGAGLACVTGLAGYLTYTLWSEWGDGRAYSAQADVIEPRPASALWALLLTVGGLIATILGARLLVYGAVGLATGMGISEAVIGLSIVSVGTSMPELVTSIVAARRGQGDVALGNIIGSNIFNVLGILGITALVRPMQAPESIARFDIWVMLAATAALIWFARSGWRISRTEGTVLLTAYLAYLCWLAAGL